MKNRIHPTRLSVLSLGVACAFPFALQVHAAPQQLTETVVTATRAEQPLADVVADVSIIDRDTLDRAGPGGLADVLSRIPGVELARNGGPGNNTSLFVRGAEARFTAVFIDGVRVDSQATGGAIWETIPLSQVDRVEVLRGPAAAVYGSDALGGVVQIFTKKGEGAFTPVVGFGVGRYGTRKLDAGFSGAQNGFDYALGFADEKSTGFNARTVATANPDLDGYRSQSGSGRLGYQINAIHRLDATVLSNHLNSQYDSSKTLDDHNLYKLQTVGATWQAKWSDVYTSRLSVNESQIRYETTPSPYLTTTKLRGALFQNELRWGIHRLSATLEQRIDRLENAPIAQNRSQNGLALGYGVIQAAHTLQLNVRRDQDSEFGGKSTGSAAYAYALDPQWRATASVGTAFRTPTLYQRFSDYGVASLKPESSRNLELGLRYAQGSSTFSAMAYRNTVSNLITFVSAPGPCVAGSGPFPGCYANTARAQYAGVTLAGAHRLPTALGPVDVRGSVDVQNPRDLDTGKLLARRSRQHAVLGADWRVANVLLGAETQFTGARFSSAGETVPLPGYALLNLTASTRVAQDWTLLARLDNATNKVYETVSTYATPGRSVYLGAKWAPK
jgi:vitamin B12 transporter